MATAITDSEFRSALLYRNNNDTIQKYLAQHATTAPSTTEEEPRAGANKKQHHHRHSIADAFTAWTATQEYQQGVVVNHSAVLLRWFYAQSDSHRALFEPLAPTLTAQLVDLLPMVTESSNIEAMEVLLNSWLFRDHLLDTQQISVTTESLWRTTDPVIAKILAAHGGDIGLPPGRPHSYEALRFLGLTCAQLQQHIHTHDPPSINLVGDSWVIPAAMRHGNSLKYVPAFLQAGADPHDALEHAVTNRQATELIRLLCEKGKVDMDGSYDCRTTPLVAAIRDGHARPIGTRIEVATLLLKLGADVDGCGTDKQTPVIAASLMRNHKMLALFLQHGADPNIQKYGALSPVSLLCHRRINPLHCACIKVLLEHGADPNSTESGGETMLHRLASKGHHDVKYDVIKLLVQFGGDMHLRNSRGVTPLDLLQAAAPARAHELQQMNFRAALRGIEESGGRALIGMIGHRE